MEGERESGEDVRERVWKVLELDGCESGEGVRG